MGHPERLGRHFLVYEGEAVGYSVTPDVVDIHSIC